jgi:hypothetical protein
MAHVVPSQVCDLIGKVFPELDAEPAAKGQHGNYRATDIRPVLELLARIPEELIRLSSADAALFWANSFALRNEWEDRNKSNNQMVVRPIGRAEHSSLFETKRLLAKCPDEAPAARTTGLEFLPDDPFREGLRTDISSAESALMNHEYKATAVLGGSVVEALLLWGLEKIGAAKVQATAKGAQAKKSLNEWGLGQLISAARHLRSHLRCHQAAGRACAEFSQPDPSGAAAATARHLRPRERTRHTRRG